MKIKTLKDNLTQSKINEVANKFNISTRVASLLLGRGISESLIRSLTSNIQVLPKSNNITNYEYSILS